EWGLGMRLTGVRDFPRQMMLGAVRDSTLVFNMGAAIANQCKRLGVHINFAPVLDVNNNPNNPVINFRSFGENKERVARWGYQYMRGLQENGILACAKHFPGHGDTDVDSHNDLPVISKSRTQLDDIELYPFKALIQKGIGAMMIAHLQVPALDTQAQTPTTLSEATVTDLLKNELGFKGLVFTDALNMKGVAKYYTPGEIDLKAFMAGNDVLLFSQDVAAGKEKIAKAIQLGQLSEERLAESVKKILAAKYVAGLHRISPIDTNHCVDDLNRYVSIVRKQVARESITLLRDPNLVLKSLQKKGLTHTAYLAVGIPSENKLIQRLLDQQLADVFYVPETPKGLKALMKKLHRFDQVIVGVHKLSPYPGKQFGYSDLQWDAVKQAGALTHSIVVLMGNPYAIRFMPNCEAIMVAYDDVEETQEQVSQIILGQAPIQGKLPVSVNDTYRYGDGMVSMLNALGEVRDSTMFKQQMHDPIASHVNESVRIISAKDRPLICCVNPNALGFDNNTLDMLDEFIESAIQSGAFPGCRIVAAYQGNVFYDKAFGYLDYNKQQAVELNTVYDLASVTKTTATTLAIMKLYEQGKLNLFEPLGTYLPSVRGTDKANLLLCDILSHQAGLVAWIPFYKETLD
ncbi:MAG: serine hydrolase, partial [Chitinophagaceae bacterium]|nr:serine hydrolase [Chitinophagaceae bacterium]